MNRPTPDLRPRRLPVARAAWALALVLPLWSGCGGGGDGVDTGGTGRPTVASVAVGPIAGFGSIVVGGVRYDETAARLIDDDDLPVSPGALQLGVMTTVEAGPATTVAGVTTAVAQTVRVSEALVGPVGAVDAAGCTLRVLGQRVAAVAATVVDASVPAATGSCRIARLSVGQVVAVYGSWDLAQGRVVASRIGLRADAPAYVLRAPVEAYSAGGASLTLGGQSVSLAGLEGLPATLATGTLARVKLRTTLLPDGRWQALRLGDAVPALASAAQVELEGRITQFASARSFTVNGVPVDASAAVFPAGQAGLAVGAQVEVEGRTVNGVLIAAKVAVEADDDTASAEVEIEARITALDRAAQTFVVRNVTVSYAGAPVFKGGTAADLALQRKVHVKGVLAADGVTVRATEIELED